MTTAYLAHWVRGLNGDNATPDEIACNLVHAQQYAAQIRRICPDLELYVPAEFETLYQQCYQASFDKAAIAELVLAQCCQIVRLCDVLLVANEPSAGIQREINTARKAEKLIIRLYQYPRLEWEELLSGHFNQGATFE